MADGQSDALDTAEWISRVVSTGALSIALTAEMRDAILSVMEATPRNGLVALRDELVKDQRARA